jgi:anti-sigma regulatory factor (Ser/Thr protein kinase)
MEPLLAPPTSSNLSPQRCFLPGRKRSSTVARHWAGGLGEFWELPPVLRGEVELVVTELVANAVAHGQAGVVACCLRLTGDGVYVEVSEHHVSRRPVLPPVPCRPSGLAESGRGLLLVEALSTRWGCEPPGRPDGGRGSSVWAVLERSCSRSAA